MSDIQATGPAPSADKRPADLPGTKAYQPPRLWVHGTVAQLTNIGGAGTADKQTGSVPDL